MMPALTWEDLYRLKVLGSADPRWGKRPDGSSKGRGWLGVVPTNRGMGDDERPGVATEFTIGVSIDGMPRDIPLMVPTLDRNEIEIIRNGGEVTDAMYQKAVDHARKRISMGLSPYFD